MEGYIQAKPMSKKVYLELIDIMQRDIHLSQKEKMVQDLFHFDPESKRHSKYTGYNPKQAEYMRKYRAKLALLSKESNGESPI